MDNTTNGTAMDNTTNGTAIGSGWTIITDDAAHARALELARGSYQRGLLNGIESLSGSTLRGAARSWGSRYKISRENLLARLSAAGVLWTERRGAHRIRVLVIGSES
jgi:hypothetical protein